MNHVEFVPEDGPGGDVYVRIRIDGWDLIERLREIELPTAIAQNRESIAGDYQGLPPEAWQELPTVGDPTGPRAVLGCTCGEAGCWPMLVRITHEPDVVVWSDFDGSIGPVEVYASLGPYTFPRHEYDAAVARVLARLPIVRWDVPE